MLICYGAAGLPKFNAYLDAWPVGLVGLSFLPSQILLLWPLATTMPTAPFCYGPAGPPKFNDYLDA